MHAKTGEAAVPPLTADARHAPLCAQKLHKQLGNKWSDIGRRMKRSENQARCYWAVCCPRHATAESFHRLQVLECNRGIRGGGLTPQCSAWRPAQVKNRWHGKQRAAAYAAAIGGRGGLAPAGGDGLVDLALTRSESAGGSEGDIGNGSGEGAEGEDDAEAMEVD